MVGVVELRYASDLGYLVIASFCKEENNISIEYDVWHFITHVHWNYMAAYWDAPTELFL